MLMLIIDDWPLGSSNLRGRTQVTSFPRGIAFNRNGFVIHIVRWMAPSSGRAHNVISRRTNGFSTNFFLFQTRCLDLTCAHRSSSSGFVGSYRHLLDKDGNARSTFFFFFYLTFFQRRFSPKNVETLLMMERQWVCCAIFSFNRKQMKNIE